MWSVRALEALLSEGGESRPSRVPAAILGMHTLMSNQQYYQALGSSSIVNKEGLNSEYAAPFPSPHSKATLDVSRPHAVCFLPLLLFGSWQNFYMFMLPNLSTFSFYSSGVYALFKKPFSIPVLLKYPPAFPPKSCRGSLLICNVLIPLEFMFVCGVR